MTDKKLRATAHHEAGHAVAAWRVGCPIKAVTIVPDESSEGVVTFSRWFISLGPDWDGSPRVQRRIENLAFIALAGPAAQRRFSPRGYRHLHGSDDLSGAAHLLFEMTGNTEENDAYFRLIEVRARNFVRRPRIWTAIEAVAAALLERKTLTGKETRAVIMELTDRLIAEAHPRGVHPSESTNRTTDGNEAGR